MPLKNRTYSSPLVFVAAGLLLLLGLGLVVTGRSSASAGTSVTVSDATIGAPGGTAVSQVTANLAAADTLNGFDITITYDPTVVNVASTSVDPGWDITIPTPAQPAGTLNIARGRFSSCTGSCPLFSITWQGVSAGDGSVSLAEVVLTGTENGGDAGALTSVASNNGAITVQGAVATNTPVTPATSTPVTPATNTPVTNTPVSGTPPASATTPSGGTPATAVATTTVVAASPTTGDPSTSPTTTVPGGGSGPAATASPTATGPAAPTPTGTSTSPGQGDPVATPTPAEEVAGATTPGAGGAPAAPSAGNGLWNATGGGTTTIQMAGLTLALISLLFMSPWMVSAGTRGSLNTRCLDEYLARVEELGREAAATKRDES